MTEDTSNQSSKKPKAEPLQPIETWAQMLQTSDWLLSAASAKENWPLGFEISLSAFETALTGAAHEEVR